MNTRKPQRVIAIIPARGGSKGIRRKNLALLDEVPLLAWSIQAALQASRVDKVVVSTEDEEIAAVARQWGAEVPFLRPPEYSEDDSSVSQAIQYTLTTLKERGEEFDGHVVLFPTSPFRTPELIDATVSSVLDDYFSASTVYPFYWNPSFWFANVEDAWQQVTSNHGGLLYHAFCLATASSVQRRDITANGAAQYFEELLRIKREDSDRRYLGSPRFICVLDDAMRTDIDYPSDLVRANNIVSSGGLLWTPKKHHPPGSCEKRWAINGTADGGSTEDVIVISDDATESPCHLVLQSLTKPATLRTLIDTRTPFAGRTVRVARSGISLDFSDLRFADPTIIVDTERRLPVCTLRVHFIAGMGVFFRDVRKNQTISPRLGNLLVRVSSRGEAVLQLPEPPQTNDCLFIGFSTQDFSDCINSRMYRFDGKSWIDYRRISSIAIPQEVSIQSVDGLCKWQFPESMYYGTVRWLRDYPDREGGAVHTEPVEVDGLIRFDPVAQQWINELNGEAIVGRQKLPPIHPWAGYLSLPPTVHADIDWSVLPLSTILDS
ncbi:MAG: acylneuraminate cytidylyltransferase family protein [Bdellovibrionales bacterium]|nr:acylneuraminate cytidylyltransferase family protein [Bdellovibrionales bacterium]